MDFLAFKNADVVKPAHSSIADFVSNYTRNLPTFGNNSKRFVANTMSVQWQCRFKQLRSTKKIVESCYIYESIRGSQISYSVFPIFGLLYIAIHFGKLFLYFARYL